MKRGGTVDGPATHVEQMPIRVRVLGLGTDAQWDTSFRSGDHMIHGKTP